MMCDNHLVGGRESLAYIECSKPTWQTKRRPRLYPVCAQALYIYRVSHLSLVLFTPHNNTWVLYQQIGLASFVTPLNALV